MGNKNSKPATIPEPTPEQKRQQKIESRILRMLDHPFIIEMRDEYEIEDYQSMVTDVTNKGTL